MLFMISLNELKELEQSGLELRAGLIKDMRKQGASLIQYVLPAVKKFFKNFEVVSAEEQLYEVLDENDIKYKGFIDLVLKTDDGKYHIIDWKSCSWGWDARKKNDKMITYQLTLYKHFFAQKLEVDPKDVETHFALLKRTAKQNNVEFFRVTSGNIKTKNALKLLNTALYNIKKSST